MENKVTYELTRDWVEWKFDKKLTDEEWQVIAGNFESMNEHYLEVDFVQFMDDLDFWVDEAR